MLGRTTGRRSLAEGAGNFRGRCIACRDTKAPTSGLAGPGLAVADRHSRR